MTQQERDQILGVLEGMEVLDRKELLHRVQGNEKVLGIVLEEVRLSFTKDLPDVVKDIESAIDDNQYEVLRGKAHYIKGMAANISAHRLSYVAKTLQDAAEKSECEMAEAMFKVLKKELVSLEDSIK